MAGVHQSWALENYRKQILDSAVFVQRVESQRSRAIWISRRGVSSHLQGRPKLQETSRRHQLEFLWTVPESSTRLSAYQYFSTAYNKSRRGVRTAAWNNWSHFSERTALDAHRRVRGCSTLPSRLRFANVKYNNHITNMQIKIKIINQWLQKKMYLHTKTFCCLKLSEHIKQKWNTEEKKNSKTQQPGTF